MRLSLGGTLAAVAASLAMGAAAAPAFGQAEDDDPPAEGDDPAASRPSQGPTHEGIEGGAFDDYRTAEEREKQVAAEYGLGVRVRTVYVPKFVLELFVEEASGAVLQPGFGIELDRRKGNFEMVLGFEYENLSPRDGFWLGKNNEADAAPLYFNFDNFSWVAADLAFLWSAPFNDKLSFRGGVGLGLGVVLGDVLQTDSTCTPGADDLQEDCMANPNGMKVNEPADLPPVLPVVDLLAGFQWKPAAKLTVNLDTGFRSAPFIGLSSVIYF
jgi:hypothetical protein